MEYETAYKTRKIGATVTSVIVSVCLSLHSLSFGGLENQPKPEECRVSPDYSLKMYHLVFNDVTSSGL